MKKEQKWQTCQSDTKSIDWKSETLQESSRQDQSPADADAVRGIAKESEFTIAEDDLRNTQSESSDEELEEAAKVIVDRTWNGKNNA